MCIAPPPHQAAAKGAKAVPAHIRKMQEAQAKLKEAEEIAAREAAERERLEKEEEARAAEAARVAAEAKAKRDEEQRKKKEELKKAGLLLSDKDKAKQKANQVS